MRESDGPNSNVVGEKLCKHKYSSYPYCYGEIASETQGNRYFLYQMCNAYRISELPGSSCFDQKNSFSYQHHIHPNSILKSKNNISCIPISL